MTHPNDRSRPADESDRIVDLLLGELAAADAARLEVRLVGDAGLEAERRALTDLLALEARRFDTTEAAAAVDGARVAAAIVDQVARDEAAARRRSAQSPGRRWARILAASIALHVVVLGLVMWKLDRVEDAAINPGVEVSIAAPYDPHDSFSSGVNERLAEALADMEAAELAELPDAVIRFDGDLDDAGQASLEPLVQNRGHDAPLFEHPHGMGLFLRRRTNEALKRRRLSALGFDADGTLTRVRLGLSYLRGQQRADGSFAGETGVTALEQTALVLLPFLGEGHCSLCDGDSKPNEAAHNKTVRSGIGWIRSQVFGADGAVRGGLGERALGVALVALSEDYMLGYGRFGIDAARARTAEIGRLGETVRAAERLAGGTDGALWPIWALDAAERTGALARTPGEVDRFEAWVATALSNNDQQVGALDALSQGTALLHHERGTEKPRFLSWSRSSAEDLLGLLLPNGKAKGSAAGARIHDTALVLLGLQVSYRTY